MRGEHAVTCLEIIYKMDIPIVVVCFNNYRYVQNMMDNIKKINPHYYTQIIILDNCSTCLETIHFLQNVDVKVHFSPTNDGPWVNCVRNPSLNAILPDKFVLTDPDLELSETMPTNFIDILSELSDQYNCERIGLALDISDFDKMYQTKYSHNINIYEHEKVFWENRIDHPQYELYDADIDTTFCLVHKNRYHRKIRVAGDFTVKHLPWYVDNPLLNVYDNYFANNHHSWISTISTTITNHIETHYTMVRKRQEVFFIKNRESFVETNSLENRESFVETNSLEDRNLPFWKDTFPLWEEPTFDVFDRFLDKNKVFVDIGGWIGTTSMYGFRKSKHVYVVEADKESFHYMNQNMKNNCRGNYTCIHRALYHEDDREISFGKNRILSESVLENKDKEEITNDCYMVPTMTIPRLLAEYRIDPTEISLIKVDIEGGEENILNDLFTIHQEQGITMYIRFHYTWWKNPDLDRFDFLSQEHKEQIQREPFVSILFEKKDV